MLHVYNGASRLLTRCFTCSPQHVDHWFKSGGCLGKNSLQNPKTQLVGTQTWLQVNHRCCEVKPGASNIQSTFQPCTNQKILGTSITPGSLILGSLQRNFLQNLSYCQNLLLCQSYPPFKTVQYFTLKLLPTPFFLVPKIVLLTLLAARAAQSAESRQSPQSPHEE